MTDPIKILSLSLDSKRKYKAYSVFNGEQLVITHILPISGNFITWKPQVLHEVKDKKSKGYVVVIEERTGFIAQEASQIDFEAKNQTEDRINLYVALDYYFPMYDAGNIILPTDGARHRIKENEVEKLRDEKGRIKYNINWDTFDGGKRCILLAVMAAIYEPVSERYWEAMFGKHITQRPADPLGGFKAVTVGRVRTDIMEMEKKMRGR